MAIESINPATGERLQSFEPLAANEIDEKLQRADQTFREYRQTPFTSRTLWMENAARILDDEAAALARTITGEMGKPIRQAESEIHKCASVCRYYAGNANTFLADEAAAADAELSFIRYQPIGAILAVMPWNFPFWQVFRFAAPALMAGNTGLLKHASNVPRCALAIEDIFLRAGFPEGVFQVLLIRTEQTGELLKDPRIKAATLTGSEGAGRSVASAAGKQIKKTVLELGGSDPFIVMGTANLDEAATMAVKARCQNTGQSCIAAKRFIVNENVADEFQRRFVERIGRLKIGDPMDDSTDLGPLATEQIRQTLENQVKTSVDLGARVLMGGRRLDRPGYYYEPTVITEIPENSPAYREELFGPVAAIFRVRDSGEAIELANNTTFGLGCSVWTNDETERDRFTEEIEAGSVFVNGMVRSDPRLPFGGVKNSGYGRELSAQGIREFVNIKTVVVDKFARGV